MDVFISYEHQSKPIADNICAVLESRGIRCWYAPRDVYGDYATSIVEAIENCKVFVLILNCDSSNSPHVLNEVEMAYQRILKGEIAIVPFKVDAGLLSKAMEYYVKRLHWIDAVSEPLEKAIARLYEQLVPILGLKPQPAALPDPDCSAEVNLNRRNVMYYSPDDLIELKRLGMEEELLYEYEKPYYDKLLLGKSGLVALDLSVLNPHSPMRRLNRGEIDTAICLSYNAAVVKEGNDLCAKDGKLKFFEFNADEQDIAEVLPEIMKKAGVEKIDFINLTMVIMDLKNPFKVLNRIKRFMAPGGVAFVRDIDDGVVFAYPDKNEYFKKIKEFYKYDTLSGSRISGRQVFNVMKKLGAKTIRLERCGINTAAMDYDQKRMLFKSWFAFVPNDFNIMLRQDPSNAKAREVMDWLNEYYDDLEEEFFGDDFIFNSGYMFFTVWF